MRRGLYALLGSFFLFTTFTTSGQDLEIGKWLWLSNCSPCHGETGKPVLPLTPDISIGEGIKKPLSQKLRTVRQGAGIMPAFEGKIQEEFIVDIVAYMLTLYPKISPPRNFWDPNLM